MSRSCGSLLTLVFAAGCSGTEPAPPVAAFSVDYADSYEEVRGCRKSADHELEFVRVLASPTALEPYLDRAGEFPDGAVVLKEQYEASDDTCSGDIEQWTVMTKAAAATADLGWSWQRVAADRHVIGAEVQGCVSCHSACTGTPGYDYTCTEP